MQEFSLEKLTGNIHSGKTYKYFQEVLSSYNNGNYRSSVVMLWSVAVCDIVYKLQDLVDLYNDAAAKQILNEITSDQTKDPKSSLWELKLLDEIRNKTYLLGSAEYEDLRYLQIQRHLSAHPVLNSDKELHSPNKETVRSLIRNTLEGLLVKPPFYTQGILNELLLDVSETALALNTTSKIKEYVVSRYFNRITAQVELSLFRSIWKLVFRVENADCDKNRLINLRVLEVLAARNIVTLSDFIKGEKDYYSNIAPTGIPLSFLVYFLSGNSYIYSILNLDAQFKIQHSISSDSIGRTMGWFIKDSLDTHSTDMINWIRSSDKPTFTAEQLDALCGIADSEEWQVNFCHILTTYYSDSISYDQADSRFQVAIPKYIELFNKDSIINLASSINSNSQCYGRGRAQEDYVVIKQRIDKLFGEGFDYSKLRNFRRRVNIADPELDVDITF